MFSEGFEITDFPDLADIICDYMRHVDPDATLTHLGRLDGKPVATSTLIFGAGVAGIYNVATIPEARRQGIGGMMTLVPLREARARGFRAGILASSEMAEGVYRALGFQQYCTIGHYLWSPEAMRGTAEHAAL